MLFYFYWFSRTCLTLAIFTAAVTGGIYPARVFCGITETYKVKHELIFLSTLSLNFELCGRLVDLGLISRIYKQIVEKTVCGVANGR